MGMPISLALRGRHADDAARPTRPGRGDGRAARGRRGVQHLPARLLRLAGSAAARSPSADCPPEVAEVLELGARGRAASPTARSHRRSRTPTAAPCSTRAGWSRAGRSSGPPRCLPALDDTDFCLSAGGDLVCRTARPGAAGLADRHRGPARPDAASWPSCRSATARSPPPAPPTAGSTSSTPAPAGPPDGVASVTVVGRLADLGGHRRHRRVRARAGRRGLAAHPAGPDRAGRLGGRQQHGGRRVGMTRGSGCGSGQGAYHKHGSRPAGEPLGQFPGVQPAEPLPVSVTDSTIRSPASVSWRLGARPPRRRSGRRARAWSRVARPERGPSSDSRRVRPWSVRR